MSCSRATLNIVVFPGHFVELCGGWLFTIFGLVASGGWLPWVFVFNPVQIHFVCSNICGNRFGLCLLIVRGKGLPVIGGMGVPYSSIGWSS